MTHDDDKFLQELFSDYQPDMRSDEGFMEALGRKLDKVEYIKAVQEAQLHRYRMAVVCSLVIGIIVGGVLSGVLLLTPVDEPLFTFATTNALLLMLQHYSRLMSVAVLCGLTAWGIVGGVAMMQDIPQHLVPFTKVEQKM